jgi:Na+/H+ antiporter NhaD/arsenite permease-like protein
MSDKKPLNFRVLLVMIIFFIYSIVIIYTGIQEPTSIFDIIMGIVILLMVFILLPKELRTTKEDSMLKWEKEREKGKKYFMYVQGPLTFGFPLAIVLEISDGTNSILGLVIKLIIFYVIGLLMGLYSYHDSEKKYQRWKYDQ